MDEGEEKHKAILEELQSLEKLRKEHEWIVVGQKEAEEDEEAEARMDSEASDSAPEKPEGE
jgi:GTPase involved in cell partitioning and DNA repair